VEKGHVATILRHTTTERCSVGFWIRKQMDKLLRRAAEIKITMSCLSNLSKDSIWLFRYFCLVIYLFILL
jgi:hypothetical protein